MKISKIIIPAIMISAGKVCTNAPKISAYFFSNKKINNTCVSPRFYNILPETIANTLNDKKKTIAEKNISFCKSHDFLQGISFIYKNSDKYKAKNNNILDKYLAYINDKKIKLIENKRLFVGKIVEHYDVNTDSYYEYPILIYNTKGHIKYFNKKIQSDNNSTTTKTYVCENFALAVAKGTKPSVFNSEENIKNNPALDDKHIQQFYSEIPQEAYYFNTDQFPSVLKSIVSAIYKENIDTTKGYVLLSADHAMAINIAKKSNILSIEFYDPNYTNIAKKVVFLHPDDTENLDISDFIYWTTRSIYFPENRAVLLSTDTVTETSLATVNILTDISETDLAFMLMFGHYQANQSIENKTIIHPTLLQSKNSALMTVLNKYVPFVSSIIPYKYEIIPGFGIACQNKHLEAISNYINDLLSSNNSLESKIVALFPIDAPAFIDDNLLFCDSDLWYVFITSILKHQHINSLEKVKILKNIGSSQRLPISSIFFASASKEMLEEVSKDKLQNLLNKEVRVAAFKKFTNSILETSALTDENKLELITKPYISNYFWLCYLIKLEQTEKHLDFFTTYLDAVLNCNKITDLTKKQLVDLHLEVTEKEELLYKKAIAAKNFNFAITYIEKIIKSTLPITAKQELLDINDDSIATAIYLELASNYPELAKLCLAIIPSYKKVYTKQLNRSSYV